MLARYYSSSLGRFMAVDPSRASVQIERPATWNRYSYVVNNPLRLVDLDGRLAIDAEMARFKRTAAFILSLRPDTADFNAYRKVLGIEGLSLDVKTKFVPGSGPVVHMKSFDWPHILGDTPNENNIYLTRQMLELFEKGVPGSAEALEALVKHEVAHSLDWADGILHDPNGAEGESGYEWEYERYGEQRSDDLLNPPGSGQKGSRGGRSGGKDTSGLDELSGIMAAADARIGAVTRAEQASLSQRCREGWKK